MMMGNCRQYCYDICIFIQLSSISVAYYFSYIRHSMSYYPNERSEGFNHPGLYITNSKMIADMYVRIFINL